MGATPVVGASISFGGSNSNYFLVKTDADGDTLWTRIYGGQLDAVATDIMQTADNGYAIAGHAMGKMYLVKTDSLGTELWTRSYGVEFLVNAESITSTPEGGFILAGWTSLRPPNPYHDYYIVKTDSSGNAIWSRQYGGRYNDYAYSIDRCPAPDGGYVIAGASTSNPHYNNDLDWDIFVIRITEDGDTAWTRYYGTYGIAEESFSVVCAPNYRFVVAGNLLNTHNAVATLLCLGRNGDSLWTASWPPPDWPNPRRYARSVALTPEGDFIVCGYLDNEYRVNNGFVAKVDQNGQQFWSMILNNQSYFYSVQAVNDGGIILAGRLGFADTSDYYLVKLAPDNTGFENERPDIPSTITLSQNYPNPFNAQTAIGYSLFKVPDVSIDIFDITGRKIESLIHSKQQPGENEVVWNAGGKASGVYFYRLKAGEITQTRSCILLK